MTRVSQIALFLGIASLILGGAHLFVYLRLSRELALSGRARTGLLAAFVLLFLLLIAAIPLSRGLPRDLASAVAWVAFTWMGTLWLAVVMHLFAEILRLFLRPALPVDPARRELLGRMPGIAALGASGILSGFALWEGRREVMVRELPIKLARLPRELSGFTIVQITDLHLGPTLGGPFLGEVVRRVNALTPDLVAITGDLVDAPAEKLAEDVAPLRDLRAPQGVYFVTGNHEYFSGLDGWLAHLPTLGIRLLMNERVEIRARGAAFDLAGVEDFHASRYPGHGPDLPRALAGRDSSRLVVLLAHQPKAVLEAARLGVDLQLSGHTHGGQIWPWRYFVYLQQPYVSGLHRHPGSDTQVWVSNGTGYWGPPMRLGAPAEITRITLFPT